MNILKRFLLIVAIVQFVGCAGSSAQKQQRYDGVSDLGLAAVNLLEMDLFDVTVYGLSGTAKILLSCGSKSAPTEVPPVVSSNEFDQH